MLRHKARANLVEVVSGAHKKLDCTFATFMHYTFYFRISKCSGNTNANKNNNKHMVVLYVVLVSNC